jgi:UDP-N-acetylglucosamine--N-acetylmuramyl-(pentapeptide) pyrophosphoryl-undecaprenol N-acetylglucosamine transferase
VREAYARLGVQAIVEPFFKDLPFQIANAHLVVARAGASTVAELAVIGRPSILVPLPHALDQDQAANAASLARDGGALVRRQEGFTPDWLADTLSGHLANPAPLAEAALAARAQGIPDAAERLADLVCDIGRISLSPERPA